MKTRTTNIISPRHTVATALDGDEPACLPAHLALPRSGCQLLPGVITAMLTTIAARRFTSRDVKSTQDRASILPISLGVLEQSP
jgi:hypothetical protein